MRWQGLLLLPHLLLLGCDNLLTPIDTQDALCAEENLSCPPNSACDASTGTAQCVCLDSFQDNDADGSCKLSCEGASETLMCSSGQHCDDASGTAMCVGGDTKDTSPDMKGCMEGFQDNDVDGVCEPTCAASIDTLMCKASQVCDDTHGVAMCVCPEGTQDNDDNGTCEPHCGAFEGCDAETQNCDDSSGTPMCPCREGFQDNDNNDTCTPSCAEENPCEEGSTCDDSSGTLMCLCGDGFQDNDMDGKCEPTCQRENLNCPQNEVCSDALGIAMCVCAPGYQDEDGDNVCTRGCDHPNFAGCTAPMGCRVARDGTAACVEAPKSCEEADTLGRLNTSNDQITLLHAHNNPKQPWSASCVRNTIMDPWREYMIVQSGQGSNISRDYASGVQTQYDRYRVDPATLAIDVTDNAYATTTQLSIPTPIIPPPVEALTFAPVATARACGTGANAMGDLNTTLYPAISSVDISFNGAFRIIGDFSDFGVCNATSTVTWNTDRTAIVIKVDPSTTYPSGCSGHAPTNFANTFSRRCTEGSRNPTVIRGAHNFDLRLEYIGL